MSETPEKPKTVWQARREAVAAAIKAWQECESDGSGPLSDADSLADELREAGLILLPESSGYGQYIVSIDGEPAPFPDGRLPAGPVTGEMAADMFLTLDAADDYGKRQISIRPATDAEMVGGLVGDTAVLEDPVEVRPDTYAVTADRDNTYRVLVFGDGKHTVRVRMDRPLLEMLAAGLADEVKTQGSRS